MYNFPGQFFAISKYVSPTGLVCIMHGMKSHFTFLTLHDDVKMLRKYLPVFLG